MGWFSVLFDLTICPEYNCLWAGSFEFPL